jgi:hypothetical protein
MRTNFRKFLGFLGALVLCLGLFGTIEARAVTLYDNLSAATNDVDFVSEVGPLYDSFSTGSSTDNLNVTVLIAALNPNDGGTFQISLLTDNPPGPGSAQPGSLISTSAAFGDNLLSSTSLTPFSVSFASLSLNAATRYWIELESTGSVAWAWSTDITGLGVPNEFFANSDGVFTNEDGPYQMRVATTPIPPSLLLFVSGLIVMGLFGWRGKRNTAAFA